jgi:hypothetical protein
MFIVWRSRSSISARTRTIGVQTLAHQPSRVISSPGVKADIDDVLRDGALMRLAFAIALGWALYQLAHGLALFVDGLFTHLPDVPGGYSGAFGGGLVWIVGHHIVRLDGILTGLIDLACVLGITALLRRRIAATPAEPLNPPLA